MSFKTIQLTLDDLEQGDLIVNVTYFYDLSHPLDYYQGLWLKKIKIGAGTYYLSDGNDKPYDGQHDALIMKKAREKWEDPDFNP